ncbi:hypothetical protein ACFSDD_17565 [Salipiger marinus]|uniref:hypothetical protein n=1 Tax=Salipiger marinus TaxID=555512 RepID=UPI002BEA39D8|nr:hypothetical protein [Salipiger manganoxidans]MEB3421748.1 hypothetical protein [Salipiger manganoxidans]
MRRIDLDRLRELHAQGLSDPLVAAELGCCAKSVSNWRRRLKLRKCGNVRHQTRRFSDDDLRALHAEGLTDTDISERLGVSRGAVQWRRVMLDLPSTCAGRPHLPFDVETLLAHHAAGLTDPDIARLMGTTGCRIKYQRNKLGLAGNYKLGNPSLSNGKLRALHSEGLTDREIAERVGLSVATVGERRRNLGLPAQVRPRCQPIRIAWRSCAAQACLMPRSGAASAVARARRGGHVSGWVLRKTRCRRRARRLFPPRSR